VQLEVLGKLKKFNDLSGIEPATFWLIAQEVTKLKHGRILSKSTILLFCTGPIHSPNTYETEMK
jgi:hypothetical protein